MFIVFRRLARGWLAAGLSLCLGLASIGPSVAIACEGASEEGPVAGKIEQVNFTNNVEISVDHREDKFGEKPVKVTEYGEKNNVEWQTGANKKNWPIVYAQSTKIKLEARFALEESTRKFLKEKLEAGSTVPLVGELTLGTTTLKFEKSLTVAEVKTQLEAHEAYLTTGEVESNNALPKEVHLYENGTKSVATIEWKWTVKSGGVAFKQSLGNSEHNL
jgi:hypothetical protein